MGRWAFVLVLVMLTALATACGEGTQRTIKSFQSNFGGGLDRVLVVYDYNGQEITRYEGRFDIHAGEAGKVVFDLNGKRHIIHGGIVIVDEK